MIFQQQNAREFLQKKSVIEILDWPARSPDLWQIERASNSSAIASAISSSGGLGPLNTKRQTTQFD
jgi:hypothetical protein